MKNISPADVEKSYAELNVLDVRETEEIKSGKIPGAVNIPLGLIEFRKQELDKSKEYVVVCQAGGRSAKATQYLEDQGYQVTNMTGGMNNWQGPVE
ncbi:rhodanese-like domain-containing protein [Jeotgalibacillus aurantiacus]|uniref:rhodanese-like domain-containing protein n=1 Tax=Jeotgalibacillus aurantiacus TaxID=2763266 RepID=UPI001D0B80F5|nr:rhodanese-like domain-containing protein [Jeotgalibacillus aurantiacus]